MDILVKKTRFVRAILLNKALCFKKQLLVIGVLKSWMLCFFIKETR